MRVQNDHPMLQMLLAGASTSPHAAGIIADWLEEQGDERASEVRGCKSAADVVWFLQVPGQPFVTGSHAYGTPRNDSDLDLVVMLTPGDLKVLQDRAPGAEMTDYPPSQIETSLRYGTLNLICCTTLEKWETWKRGTWELKKEAPVSHGTAVAKFKQLFAELHNKALEKKNGAGYADF